MGDARLTAAALESARDALREEKRWRAAGNPAAEALERLYALAYARHSYRWPLLGLEGDLERIGARDCETWWREHYAPANAVLTLVGGFDPDGALELVRRAFAAVPARGARSPLPPAEPVQTAARRGVHPGPAGIRLLLAGWRASADSAADSPALALLVRALSGSGGRLDRALVQGNGSCLLARAVLDGRRQSGLFYCLAAPRRGVDSAAVEREVVAQVEELAARPIEADELARARKLEEAAMLFGLQTTHDRGAVVGRGTVVGGSPRAAWLRLQRVRGLTAADLQRVAAKVLRAANRNVLWVSPVPAAPGGPR